MSDVFITLITVMLALILMFIFPLAFIGNQNEIITGDDIRILADDFVNKASREGKIIDTDYYEFLEKLNATGNTYNVSLEVQILDNTNLSDRKDVYVVGENMYYSEFTTAIEDTLVAQGEYILKQGDYVKVKIENTNITFGTQIKRFMYGILGKDVTTMDTNSSAIVVSPSLNTEEIAKKPYQHINLTDLKWKRDYYWANDNEPWDPESRMVTDGSISRIHIDETETGANIVEMIGNSVKEGKGAAWATIEGDNIKQISFSYDLDEGDSFYDAGIMLNVEEKTEAGQMVLTGYLIAFVFRDSYVAGYGQDSGGILSRSGYVPKNYVPTPTGPHSGSQTSKYSEDETGAIIKFKYIVGKYAGMPLNNKRLMNGADLEVLGTFNASRETGTAAYDPYRLRRYKGKVKIKITDEGYKINISNGKGKFDYDLNVNKSDLKPNTIGFFSEHHVHGCSQLGHFKLYNVKVVGNIMGT